MKNESTEEQVDGLAACLIAQIGHEFDQLPPDQQDVYRLLARKLLERR